MRKIWGKFILKLARFIEIIVGGLSKGVNFVVTFVSQLGKILWSALVMVACGGFFILGPFLLFNPYAMVVIVTSIFIFVIIPMIGKIFASWLDYINYSAVEFLRNYGDYLINNKANFKSYREFSKDYKDKKAREEREREEQQRAQNDFWEEIFKNFTQGGGGFYYKTYNMNDEDFGNQFGGYSGYGGQRQGYGGYNQSYGNPLDDFRTKYKESCKVLGVPENTDKYEVKTAYRKLAKKYHPDINKSSEATEMFQKVNSAYEFLSEENIQRYNKMNIN
ncbi:DnaJ domain-containing protein [Miniphocaeibacter massiliensis]|uniref:DnaJ domain-containing protein n=1 Tax=Miniphocaeibacter massiliensis TaxID=2041841 RepID=UPI000C06A5B0|nr:DnaJ domain-containing protein [Miniphocaeibacter massiliensis]